MRERWKEEESMGEGQMERAREYVRGREGERERKRE